MNLIFLMFPIFSMEQKNQINISSLQSFSGKKIAEMILDLSSEDLYRIIENKNLDNTKLKFVNKLKCYFEKTISHACLSQIIKEMGKINSNIFTAKSTELVNNKFVKTARFLHNRKYILVENIDNEIMVFDFNGNEKSNLSNNDIKIVKPVSNKKYVLKVCNHEVQLFGINKKLIGIFKFKNNINSATFSPDGKYILIGGDYGLLEVLDLKSKKKILRLNNFDSLHHVKFAVFSPTGEYILTVNSDCDITYAGPDYDIVRLWKMPYPKTLYKILDIILNKEEYTITEIILIILFQKEKWNLFDSPYCTPEIESKITNILNNIDNTSIGCIINNK
ncbi:WD40 repeat domain-containing protein [Candidatus Dependentiae bacterium]